MNKNLYARIIHFFGNFSEVKDAVDFLINHGYEVISVYSDSVMLKLNIHDLFMCAYVMHRNCYHLSTNTLISGIIMSVDVLTKNPLTGEIVNMMGTQCKSIDELKLCIEKNEQMSSAYIKQEKIKAIKNIGKSEFKTCNHVLNQ